MEKTRNELLERIDYLCKELEKATLGEDKPNGRHLAPSADYFYSIANHIYDTIDEFFENFGLPHLSINDWQLVNDQRRNLILDIDVLRENKRIQGEELTRKLENYLSKIKGDVNLIHAVLTNSCSL